MLAELSVVRAYDPRLLERTDEARRWAAVEHFGDCAVEDGLCVVAPVLIAATLRVDGIDRAVCLLGHSDHQLL